MERYTIYPKRAVKFSIWLYLSFITVLFIFTFFYRVSRDPSNWVDILLEVLRNFISFNDYATSFVFVVMTLVISLTSVFRCTVYIDSDCIRVSHYLRNKTLYYPEIQYVSWRMKKNTPFMGSQIIEISTGLDSIELPKDSFLRADLTKILQNIKFYAPQAQFDSITEDIANDFWGNQFDIEKETTAELRRKSFYLTMGFSLIIALILTAKHFYNLNVIKNYSEHQQTRAFSQEELIELENKAEEASKIFNVTARRKVAVFFDLGDAYSAHKKYELAITAYRQGLVHDPKDPEYQFKLAILELRYGEEESGIERLKNLVKTTSEKTYIEASQTLLNKYGYQIKASDKVLIPDMYNYTLYLVNYDKIQPDYASILAKIVREQYRISVTILDEHLKVVEEKKRTTPLALSNRQYSAETQCLFLYEKYKSLLEKGDTVGVIGLVPHDIYAEDTNFVFSLTFSGAVGVINCQRLLDTEDLTIKRMTKQVFSSIGHLMGIAKCTNSYCARSYSHSLDELDEKEDSLCQDCQNKLTEVYNNVKKR